MLKEFYHLGTKKWLTSNGYTDRQPIYKQEKGHIIRIVPWRRRIHTIQEPYTILLPHNPNMQQVSYYQKKKNIKQLAISTPAKQEYDNRWVVRNMKY